MNNTDNKSLINRFLANRDGVFEIFTITIMLALGVSLIANYLYLKEEINKELLFYIGIVLVLFSLFYLVYKKLKAFKYKTTIPGFIIYNEKNNEIVPVYDYDFSEDLSRTFNSLVTEKPAYLHLWEKEKLGDIKADKISPMINSSGKLIIEAIEFYLLKKLSTHLSTYFQTFKGDKYIKEYGRKDISDILIENRVIELFTTPIEDREAFVNNANTSKTYIDILRINEKGEQELFQRTLPSGEHYERVHFSLPHKSSIKKADSTTLVVSTPKIIISMRVNFYGFNTSIPPLFLSRYVKQNMQEIIVYDTSIDIEVKIRFLGLFSVTGWKYNSWVDSFLHYIDKKINRDLFFQRINWDNVQAQLIAFRTPSRPKHSSPLEETNREIAASQQSE